MNSLFETVETGARFARNAALGAAAIELAIATEAIGTSFGEQADSAIVPFVMLGMAAHAVVRFAANRASNEQ